MTLVTTLLDAAAYPADALAELYGTRWRIEENLKSLKQTMKMDVLKCMTVDGVLKELTMYALAYNLVRVTMCQAAGRQGVEADRVSFIDARGGSARGGGGDAGAGGQSTASGVVRAAGEEAANQAVPSDEEAAVCIRKPSRDKDLAA